MIADLPDPRDFALAIKRSPRESIRLIAEIKRASPSRGILREIFAPKTIARIYEQKKVDAISVLTEEFFFLGNLDHISEVKTTSSRPILRKDFIIDAYQLYESRVFGADAILLIAAILGKNQASEYLHIARELGLSVLFEVHDFPELEMALSLACDIIGINNRDLDTLRTDISTTFSLKNEIPPGTIVVSESGIDKRSDVESLEDLGIDAMLIGTSLMSAKDIGRKIDELMGRR